MAHKNRSCKSVLYNVYSGTLFTDGSTAFLIAVSEMSPFYNVFPYIARAITRAICCVTLIIQNGILSYKEKMGKKSL